MNDQAVVEGSFKGWISEDLKRVARQAPAVGAGSRMNV